MTGTPSEAERQGRTDGRTVRFKIPRQALRGGTGAQLGFRAGESLEFHDYRDYVPGDDLRNLDWNVLARTDREVVRVHREEIAPVIEVFRDRSESMTVPPAKSAAADYLFGLLTAAAPTCRVIERDEPHTPRAVRVLVSDLLTADDPDQRLARLSHQAATVIVIRLLAREERDPTPGGACECTDVETGERRELVFDAKTIASYRTALAAHTERWQQAATRHAATFVDVIADGSHGEMIATLARSGIVEGVS